MCGTHRSSGHFRTHSHHSPCDAFSSVDDETCAKREVTWKVRPGLASAAVRAWSCTIVESYWG